MAGARDEPAVAELVDEGREVAPVDAGCVSELGLAGLAEDAQLTEDEELLGAEPERADRAPHARSRVSAESGQQGRHRHFEGGRHPAQAYGPCW